MTNIFNVIKIIKLHSHFLYTAWTYFSTLSSKMKHRKDIGELERAHRQTLVVTAAPGRGLRWASKAF